MVINIQTLYRRKILTQATSGAINKVPAMKYIAIGTGGIDENGNVKSTFETQTTLYNEISRYPIFSIEYPVETTARYSVVITENDLVGEKISEIGLFDEDNNLCAIKTMYEKIKDDAILFEFIFDDEF